MRKIESQPIGGHQRALLLDMRAENLPQRGVQQVRGGMIERNGFSTLNIDLRGHSIAYMQFTAFEHPDMGKRCANLLGVAHGKPRAGALEGARIADLAAAFRIEGRVVEDHLTLLSLLQYVDDCAVKNERSHLRAVGETLVTGKISLAGEFDRITQLCAELARRSCASALRLHRDVESRLIDAKASLARHVRREIRRKAVRVV